jgi:hypothetical protein
VILRYVINVAKYYVLNEVCDNNYRRHDVAKYAKKFANKYMRIQNV